MRNGLAGWLRLACLPACLVAPAAALAQATLVADAHVSSARPGVNSGTLTNLNVGGGYTALVQFDLSMLPAGTTLAQVTRAVLVVYCNRADTAGVVSVQPVSAAWTEYGVTFANLPSLGTVIQTAQVSAADTFVTFDVTAAVQGWISGASSNNGLALTAGTAVVQFDSKENDETAHAPALQITLAAGGVGTQGPVGATGPTGPAGPQGLAGLAGAQGPQGVAGARGATGTTGPTGATGATGSQGAAGISVQGPTGPAGPAGAVGATGATGSPGLVYQGAYSSVTNYALGDVVLFGGASYASLVGSNHGNTPGASPAFWGVLTAQGPQGVQGVAGATGAQGLPGPAGSVGPPGEKGDQGLQGPAGQAGAQGIPGVTGADGLQGPMGPQGVAGPVGMSFRGAYDSTVNYALADGVVWQGSGYVSLVSGNHGNTPDQSPQSWALFATGTPGAVGPQGTAGPAGAPGPMGQQGFDGAAGAPGPMGLQGPAGVNYTGNYSSMNSYGVADAVSYGGSSYVSLVTNNHGNTPDQSPAYWAVLVAQGPQGLPGATGPVGPAGAAGANGTPGATGPIGPQGLKGDPGLQGPAGAQGLTGPAGPQGDKGDIGAQGPAGQAGAQGIAGVTGQAGPQGPAGVQGAAGAPGATGSTGPAGAVGMNFRGAWTQGTNYALNDAVTFAGSTFLAQGQNFNQQPDAAPQTWAVVAQAGGPGATGAAGAPGAAASITVGSVTTLPAGSLATVTNGGTANAAVLHFAIPQGAAGTGGSGGSSGGVAGVNPAGVYHTVSFSTAFYSVNAPTAAASESAAVLAWVPRGCSAVRLDVFSQQSNAVTVTLRNGLPGAMADTALSCIAASGGSCTATGAVTVAAGGFIDLSIAGTSGTPAGVWTQLECD